MNIANWIDFLKLVGISSVPAALLIIAVLLLGKKFAERIFDSIQEQRRLDRTKVLEEFKSALQVAAVQHQVTFSKLHEERAKVIEEVYGLLAELDMAMRPLVSILRTASDPPKGKMAETAQEALRSLYRCIRKKDLFFDDATRKLMDDITNRYTSAFARMTLYPLDEPARTDAEDVYKAAFWKDAADMVHDDIPPLMERLPMELQKLLGVQGSFSGAEPGQEAPGQRNGG